MADRRQDFIEYQILAADAERGIHYSSFEDFWQKRMEPQQLISADAKGALAAVRQINKERAQEQWLLFTKNSMLEPVVHALEDLQQKYGIRA